MMIPVVPYQVRRSQDGLGAKFLVRFKDRKGELAIPISVEQGRLLAAELLGLGTDRCASHHLPVSVAQVLGARITAVVIREAHQGWVVGSIRLESPSARYETDADMVAALAMAVHLGIPVFVDGDHTLIEEALSGCQGPIALSAAPEIPQAFREVIEGLDVPSQGDGTNG